MLSAVKNFAFAFIMGLALFGIIAYLIVGMVMGNIAGIFNDLPTETEETSTVDTSVGDGPSNRPNTGLSDRGNSFNLLVLVTDYRPETYVNYDPEKLFLLYGIREEKPTYNYAPEDASRPAHVTVLPDTEKDLVHTDNGSLSYPGGFYKEQYRAINTLSLSLISYDKENGRVVYSALPIDAYIEYGGKSVRLGDFYGNYGYEELKNKVHVLTGLMIDNYAIVTIDDLPALVDEMGGIKDFRVPCAMRGYDETCEVDIALNDGFQSINGEKFRQILLFKSYPQGVSANSTALQLLRAIFTDFTDITKYSGAVDRYKRMLQYMDTDIELKDFKYNLDLIYSNSAFTKVALTLPTKNGSVGGQAVQFVDEAGSLELFLAYRRVYN